MAGELTPLPDPGLEPSYYTSRWSGEEIDRLLEGKNLVITEVVESLSALESMYPSGKDGYYQAKDTREIYMWDKKTSQWVSVGKLEGPRGERGYTFTPHMEDGVLSWTNDGDLENPQEEDLTGVGIYDIRQTGGDHSPASLDEYTITLTNGKSYKFYVRNGAGGDMPKSVYDPQGKEQDIFAYGDENYLKLTGGTVTGPAIFSGGRNALDVKGVEILRDPNGNGTYLTGQYDNGTPLLMLQGTKSQEPVRVSGVADPAEPYDAVNKQFVDDAISKQVQIRRDTDENLRASNPVLPDGAIVLVDMPDGSTKTKVGDGTHHFLDLPYGSGHWNGFCKTKISEESENVLEVTLNRFDSQDHITLSVGSLLTVYFHNDIPESFYSITIGTFNADTTNDFSCAAGNTVTFVYTIAGWNAIGVYGTLPVSLGGTGWNFTDDTPTADSTRMVTSAGIKDYVDNAIAESKGTMDYNDLENKPTVNGIPLEGNVTIEAEDGEVEVVDLLDEFLRGESVRIVIPEGTVEIRPSLFYQHAALKQVSLPRSLTSIGDRAFYACGGLTHLTIRSTLVSIASNAFGGCWGLKELNVPWAEGAVDGAPWGAAAATINYDYVPEEDVG